MAKLFKIVSTIMLLGLATLLQAQTPQPGPNSKRPDSSSVQDDIGALRERKAGLDKKVADQEMELARVESTFLNSKDGRSSKTKIKNAKNRRDKAIKDANDKYNKFMDDFSKQKDASTSDKQACCVYTSPEKVSAQRRLQVAEFKAYEDFDKEREQILESALKKSNPKTFDEYKKAKAELKNLKPIRDKIAKKLLVAEQKAEQKEEKWPWESDEEKLTGTQDNRISDAPKDERKHYAVDDVLNRTDIIEKEPAKPDETKTARRQQGGETPKPEPDPKNTSPTNPADDPISLACQMLGGEWRSGTLPMVRQIATDWSSAIAACPAGTVEALRGCGGITFQAYMRTLMIWNCHVSFLRLARNSSSDDRGLAREEGCAIEKTLGKMAEHIKATGFMTAGASWKPVHIDLREKWQLEEDLCAAATAETVGVQNPPASASSTEKKTGVTTTSVRNPDGTRTVTKTDKDGKVISTETVGKSPTSASSTDTGTGVTTTSVKNPDGTRTVTRTDRDGNVISSEKVGESPDSASSTEVNTGETTTSVANPDGTRTVTRTDRDGNVISREKVR